MQSPDARRASDARNPGCCLHRFGNSDEKTEFPGVCTFHPDYRSYGPQFQLPQPPLPHRPRLDGSEYRINRRQNDLWMAIRGVLLPKNRDRTSWRPFGAAFNVAMNGRHAPVILKDNHTSNISAAWIDTADGCTHQDTFNKQGFHHTSTATRRKSLQDTLCRLVKLLSKSIPVPIS